MVLPPSGCPTIPGGLGLPMPHQSLGLIFSYFAGEDNSTKNVPTTTESTSLLALMSTSGVLTMAMFLLLDKFRAKSELKSVGAFQHPDKAVCHFSLLILAMSHSSDALLDRIADYLRFISNAIFSGFCSIRATTMAATLPVDSVWTQMTMRLCRLSLHRPLVTSSCQLVVASTASLSLSPLQSLSPLSSSCRRRPCHRRCRHHRRRHCHRCHGHRHGRRHGRCRHHRQRGCASLTSYIGTRGGK